MKLLTTLTFALTLALPALAEEKPNVIIFFVDDMGYADISPFGANPNRTPNLTQIANEGVTFTSFYSGFASCTSSRAALMTGCYPRRVGIAGNFAPESTTGLNPDETTIADMLKDHGYATGMVGKWHLGALRPFLPTSQGFDFFYGFPYSHDMWRYHPEEHYQLRWGGLPLYHGDEVVDPDVLPKQLETLSRDLTDEALKFIETTGDQPFFLYYAHPFPHVPIYVTGDFNGHTGEGIYADNVAELDHHIGRLMDELEKMGKRDNTLVIFSSDNGPWLQYGSHGGSAGPFRAGKGHHFEGGFRVPGIISWPAKIQPAKTDMVCGGIDVLPTIAAATGATLPDVKLDGKSLLPAMTSQDFTSPHDYFFYDIKAVRHGQWKLLLPGREALFTEPRKEGHPIDKADRAWQKFPLSLFDLENDRSETTNVIDQHPEMAAKLKEVLDAHTAELKANARPVGGKKKVLE